MTDLEPKKLALIRIWQILKEYSDCDHPLTQEDIARKLEDIYGIALERKAISRNISLLKEAGYEIKNGNVGVYLAGRDFDDSELHMLIDGVLSSNYITAKHSKDLIDRLCSLSSKYFKSNMTHVHSVNDWNKTDNKSVFYNIELIDFAIAQGKQVHYDYNKYGLDCKLHKSSHQYISPYGMILHNQRYYLIGYSEIFDRIIYNRLDRITNMEMSENPVKSIRSIPGYENGIDYKEISSAMPYMYSDNPERIEFIADMEIVDQIVDWFGKNARMSRIENSDRVKVSVKASPAAMEHWATQYISHVEVVAPQRLREKIKEELEKGIKKYND